jgi:4a-hydroxytetrahydrobiopterin dehydratase
MMPIKALTLAQAQTLLPTLPTGWQLLVNPVLALEKTWRFTTFLEALAFINQVGGLAEAQNHHPEINNSYTQVTLRLSTHDVSGLSQRDVAFIKALEQAKA